MFDTTICSYNGFDCIVLKDVGNNTEAVISPSCGGILLSFSILHNNVKVETIDSYESPDDFKKNVEKKGFKGCKLSPFVCRLKNGVYHFGEYDFKIKKFYSHEHAIHGIIYDLPFQIIAKEVTDDYAKVEMVCNYRKMDEGYPFEYDCGVVYTLYKENKLTISTTITNKDKGLIPIQDGWHPYFKLGTGIDNLQLEFQSKQLVEFDSELIPTSKMIPFQNYRSLKNIDGAILDNCFLLNFTDCQPMCVLRNPDLKLQIEILPDTSYPYLQVYTPPLRTSIAIENLSGAPDGFNNGLGVKILEPFECAVFVTSYKITNLAIQYE